MNPALLSISPICLPLHSYKQITGVFSIPDFPWYTRNPRNLVRVPIYVKYTLLEGLVKREEGCQGADHHESTDRIMRP